MRQFWTRAPRPRLFLLVTVVSVITLVASSPIYPAVRGSNDTAALPETVAGGTRGKADCSRATAGQLVEQHRLNDFALPNPVRQLLCGPFTGPGSEAMAITIAAPTCWGVQRWAVFGFTNGAWQLVLDERRFIFPLVVVGSGIRETTPVFRQGDPRCIPSGGKKARIWRWNGTRLAPGPWRQITKGQPKPKKPSRFDSPTRNITCWMYDGAAANYRPGVGCESDRPVQRVNMNANGRLKICRGTRCNACGCDEPGSPPLGYGKQITVGRFRCISLRTGVRCTVIRSGKGFLINSSGVRRVGP